MKDTLFRALFHIPRSAAVTLVCSLLALAACGDSSGPPPSPAALAVVGSSQLDGIVGSAVVPKPAVRVTDATGQPIPGVPVAFVITSGDGSSTGNSQLTNGDGVASVGSWTLGTLAGANTLSAAVDGLTPIEFTATGMPDAAVSLAFASLPEEVIENSTLSPTIQVELRDQYGNRATTSSATITLSFNQNPPNTTLVGTTEVATVNGLATFANVVVSAPDLAAPVVTSIEPPVVTSGVSVRITGTGFGTNGENTTVSINGTQAVVSSSSSIEMNLIAPQLVDCEPTRQVPFHVDVRPDVFNLRLRASAPGFQNSTSPVISGVKRTTVQHTIRSASQLLLGIGESRVLTTGEEARCVELPDLNGKYMISVFSSNSTSIVFTPFLLRGKASPPLLLANSRASLAPATSLARTAPAQRPRRISARDDSDLAHTSVLQRNAKILSETPHPLRRGGVARVADAHAALVTPPPPALAPAAVGTVGELNEFRYSFTSCGEGYKTIMGRTRWVGTHSIIVEDVAPFGSPVLNGTLDQRYAEIGAEFDAAMLPIVLANFGNPFRVDAGMPNPHGKVIMLFTDEVRLNGAQAFVFSCDFFPRSTFAKSNEAPIFYSRVPISGAPGTSPTTPEGWQRVTRSTVIHEVKHIASYAERIFGNGPNGFEEPWLEEGGARLAEELYGRAFYGNQWRGNATYVETFRCDMHPEEPGCAQRPFIMPKHFGATANPPALYDFLNNPETSSTLCIDQLACDAIFYAASWSLIRWALDNFALGESQFMTQLTQNSALKGAPNILSTAGLPSWTSLMGEWSLMLATDDLPGFSPVGSLRMHSWNLRAVFQSLHEEFPTKFEKPYPLTPHTVTFGDFLFSVPALISGGFSIFELSGTQNGGQVVELQSNSGGAPPASLRMAIVRIQ